MDDRLRGLRLPLLALALLSLFSVVVLAYADDGHPVRDGFEARVVKREETKSETRAGATPENPAQPTARIEATPTPSSTEEKKEPVVTDEEYVRHVCVATTTFQRSFEQATANIRPTNAEDALRALVGALSGPLEILGKDLDAVNPPHDLEQWHDDAVERLKRTVEEVKAAERADNLGQFPIMKDGPFPKPPQEVEGRLRKVAESVKECEEAGTFLG